MLTNLSYILSAALYGVIPLVSLLLPTGASFLLSGLISLMISVTMLPGLLVPRWRQSLKRVLSSPRLLLMGGAGPFILLIYFGLMFIALDKGHAGTVIILVETWPLFQAYLICLIMPERFTGFAPRDILVGVIGVIGLVYISQGSISLDWITLVCGLSAAVAMALSSGIKTKFVIEMKEINDVGVVESFFMVSMIGLPVMALFTGAMLLAQRGAEVHWEAPVVIGAISIASTLLASLGSIYMKSSSSLFIFLLTPVFGVIFTGFYLGFDLGVLSLSGFAILLVVNAICMLPRKGQKIEP